MTQENIYYATFQTQDFSVYIAATKKGLCFVGNTFEHLEALENWCDKTFNSYSLEQNNEEMKVYIKELEEYFEGNRKNFTFSIDPKGTDFQKKVWEGARNIPYGVTVSYGELAENIGKTKKSSRAVGGALGKNPIMIVTPCHRVLSSEGKLHGFTGGLELKSALLDLENSSYKRET